MTGIDNLIAPEGPYTRIGNQLLEALPLVKLNRTQENICIFLWRRTYGWNRTRDAISLTDFAAACGHCKEYVSKQIKALMRKRIIRRIFVPGRVSIYSFVADTAQWEKGCIDLEALVRNREAGIYCCANEELIDVTSDPEALWSDQAGEELDELCEGLMKTSEEMDCPIMEKGWLDGSEDMRENEINPADQRPAHITAPELNPRSSKESTSYISQELNFGTTQELNSNTTQELNSNTTQELNSNTTQELNSNTTQELYSSTTPEQVAAPASPGTADQLKTELKTVLKTELKTELKTDKKTTRNKKEFTPDMLPHQLATLLWTKIKANIPHFKEPNMQEWSRAMDLILRVDKIDEELLREVIRFSQEDDFWLTNIHSPERLRKNFYQLDMQRRRQRSGQRAPNLPSGKDDWDMEKEEYEHFFD